MVYYIGLPVYHAVFEKVFKSIPSENALWLPSYHFYEEKLLATYDNEEFQLNIQERLKSQIGDF